MTVHEIAAEKIRQLPDTLAQEVSDFIDFLLAKRDSNRLRQFTEGLQLSESDFGDYLANLEEYEKRLARGEVRW